MTNAHKSNKAIPPNVSQTTISDEDGDLFSLPLKMNGPKIRKPTDHSEEYFWSENVVEHLKDENISEATEAKKTSVETKPKKPKNGKSKKKKL